MNKRTKYKILIVDRKVRKFFHVLLLKIFGLYPVGKEVPDSTKPKDYIRNKCIDPFLDYNDKPKRRIKAH